MKRVVITGASGFLGKKLTEALTQRQIQVTAVVRDAGKLAEMKMDHLYIVEADLKDYCILDQRIPAGDYDAFYHFAWAATSGPNRENYEVQMLNVQAACAAVAAAAKIGCERFINAGSLMEYESQKLMEQPGRQPVGNYLYRSAKLAAHYMAKAEAGRRDLAFMNMIISNTYGEGEISNRLISMVLQKLISGQKVSYTDGKQLYDFIHLDDAVEAFCRVGECGQAFHDYYIGSGQVRPLREYIEELYSCIPVECQPEFGGIAYDGLSLSYEEFDKEALYKDTGFRCSIPFSEGIRRAYAWMREYMEDKNAEV